MNIILSTRSHFDWEERQYTHHFNPKTSVTKKGAITFGQNAGTKERFLDGGIKICQQNT